MLYSCDTFAMCANSYATKRNTLAKDSDRPLGECQPIRYFPAQDHNAGEQVECTYVSVPQAAHTYAMLGCQPYWIWGFEMGINEHGLAIGNEGEWSKCDKEEKYGLLGMDLLRLALERCKTCREAIALIGDFMAQHGQRGNASAIGEDFYENSYMLIDPQEVWVMETAGRSYVAKQVHDYKAISNCYSIGEDFDLSSPNLEEFARQRLWLAPHETFSFRKHYTKITGGTRGAVPRWRRMEKLLNAAQKPMDDEFAKSVLRDHFEGELNEPYFGATAGIATTICMHASSHTGPQTAASVLFSFDETLGIIARYAPSVPCCSVFIPVYLTGKLPDAMERGSANFDPDSLWWQTERLAMAISVDEPRFGEKPRKALRALEAEFAQKAAQAEAEAAALIKAGRREEATALLFKLTADCTEQMLELVKELYEQIAEKLRADGGVYGYRQGILKKYGDRVNMHIV